MKGGPVDEVLASILNFPQCLGSIASQISTIDNGPFPLYHPIFTRAISLWTETSRYLELLPGKGRQLCLGN